MKEGPSVTQEQALAQKLAICARHMENVGIAPYDEEPVMLKSGELRMLVAALQLLHAVRVAAKTD